MTVIRMSVATVTASLAAEISLCAVIGRRKWRYNRSIKPAPAVCTSDVIKDASMCFKRVKCVEKSTFILSFVRFLSWHKSETNSRTHSYTFTHLRTHARAPTVILFLSFSLSHTQSTIHVHFVRSDGNVKVKPVHCVTDSFFLSFKSTF